MCSPIRLTQVSKSGPAHGYQTTRRWFRIEAESRSIPLPSPSLLASSGTPVPAPEPSSPSGSGLRSRKLHPESLRFGPSTVSLDFQEVRLCLGLRELSDLSRQVIHPPFGNLRSGLCSSASLPELDHTLAGSIQLRRQFVHPALRGVRAAPLSLKLFLERLQGPLEPI